MTRILVIDNYDSFVYTLNGYLMELGAETDVVRNDSFEKVDAAARMADYDGVLVSPGPGKPADAGPRDRSNAPCPRRGHRLPSTSRPVRRQ